MATMTQVSIRQMIRQNREKFSEVIQNLGKNGEKFGKATIYLPDIDFEMEGYLYQDDSGHEVFLAYNEKNKSIPEIIDAGKVNADDEIIAKAVALIAIQQELVPVPNAKNVLKQIVSGKTEHLDSFLKGLEDVEMDIPKISYDAFQIDDIEYVLTDCLTKTEKAEGINELEELAEEFTDEIDKVISASKEEEEQVATENEEQLMQTSIFDFLPEEAKTAYGKETKTIVDGPKTVHARRKRTRSVKKTIQEEAPKITREEALAKRPLVLDDEWALRKLKSFDLPKKMIEACMEFRKLQREGGPGHPALTPEQIMMIPTNGKYTGWSEPIRHGLAAMLTRKNMLIRGETSTGKTTLVKTMCAILNYPMTFVGASVDTGIEDLIGINTLENGNVGVKNAPLITAMKNGALFYLDEGNSALPSVLIKIHSAIDDERIIYNMLTAEEIHAHPNFLFATTINDGYNGTVEMNDATVDRLVGIETKYMTQKDLENYLRNYPGIYTHFQKHILKLGDIDEYHLLLLVEIAKAIQMGVTSGNLPEKMGSLRNINYLYDLIKVIDIKDAIKMIVRKYPKEERPSLAGVLAQVEALELTAEEILEI